MRGRRAALTIAAAPGLCCCAWFARLLIDFHRLARRQARTSNQAHHR